MTGIMDLAVYGWVMPRVAPPICLESPDRMELERWVAAHGTPQQVTQRCRIILAAANGAQNQEVAQELEINPKTVALWRTRFCREGPDCLWEVAEGRGFDSGLRANGTTLPNPARGLWGPSHSHGPGTHPHASHSGSLNSFIHCCSPVRPPATVPLGCETFPSRE
jgi:Homeodomain-like domain